MSVKKYLLFIKGCDYGANNDLELLTKEVRRQYYRNAVCAMLIFGAQL